MRNCFILFTSYTLLASAVFSQSAEDVLNSLKAHLDSSNVELLRTSFVQVYTEIENPSRFMGYFNLTTVCDIQFKIEDDSGNSWLTSGDLISGPQKFEKYEEDYYQSAERELRFYFDNEGQVMTVRDQFHLCVWMNENGFEMAFEPWQLSSKLTGDITLGEKEETFFQNTGKYSLVWKKKQISPSIMDHEDQDSWWDSFWD